MKNNPRIAFLFPYRWLIEDREYLSENIRRRITKQIGGEDEAEEVLQSVLTYKVEISYQHHKPVDIPLTKIQMQKLLKNVFENGKCLSVDTRFEQHRSKTMLPLCDFRIYF